MPLESGARLGPYEILTPLGAGGMGEVYRGRDSRLGRDVAIKVLPAQASANPELRERFEREAQLISSLNHPHICTLHDVGRHDTTSYLVMELLEGETLAQRLERGPLKVEAALKVAAEVCSALARAHQAGIVHRDLKPGNIMLTRAGAKVLDFGIAKLTESPSGLGAAGNLPTRTTPLTAQGAILGTLSYMAPEQLEGKEVGPPADLFALGAVLYEMLTGKRAFDGTSQASVIAGILEREPKAPSSLDPSISPALDRVVLGCLAKDPQDRRQSAHDLARELKGLAGAPVEAAVRLPDPRPSRLPWVVAAICFGGAGVLGVLAFFRADPPSPVVRFDVDQGGNTAPPFFLAVSPGGDSIAYVSGSGEDRQLLVRRLDEAEPRRMEASKGAYLPFWSPSGAELGYLDGGKIRVVAVAGGKSREVCDIAYGAGVSWGEGGAIAFSPAFNEGLKLVDAAGGSPRPLTRIDEARGESGHVWPVFLPGGKKVLFLSRTTASVSNRIEIATVASGERQVVTEADALVGYSAPWLLFVRAGELYGQRFDPGSEKVSGERVKIAPDVDFNESWATASASVASDVLAWHPYRANHAVAEWWSGGTRVGTAFEEDDLGGMLLSPDGRRVAIQKLDPARGAPDVWVIDLERSVRTRITNTRGAESLGPWLPDGSELLFSSDEHGPYAVYRCASDGSSEPSVVVNEPGHDWFAMSVTPDGEDVFSQRSMPDTREDLWRVPLASPKERTAWIATDANETGTRVSPDGRWVAYRSDRSGVSETYVRPIGGGPAVQVSIRGSGDARWDPDGGGMYLIDPAGHVAHVSIRFEGGRALPGKPEALPWFDGENLLGWDVAPDGRLLLVRTTVRSSGAFRVAVGWRATVR